MTQIAAEYSVSVSTVSEAMNLTKLPPEILRLVQNGELAWRSAVGLLELPESILDALIPDEVRGLPVRKVPIFIRAKLGQEELAQLHATAAALGQKFGFKPRVHEDSHRISLSRDEVLKLIRPAR